jgi:hypothetical protein
MNQINQFVFIGGAPRSGTTMIQNILANHSGIHAGPEFDWTPELARIFSGIKRGIQNG